MAMIHQLFDVLLYKLDGTLVNPDLIPTGVQIRVKGKFLGGGYFYAKTEQPLSDTDNDETVATVPNTNLVKTGNEFFFTVGPFGMSYTPVRIRIKTKLVDPNGDFVAGISLDGTTGA